MRLPSRSGILVLGLGHPTQGDAAAGQLVARHLTREPAVDVQVQEVNGDEARWVETWKGATFVIVVGAVYSSEPPGTIYRLDAAAQSVPRGFFVDSNGALSLSESVEWARTFRRLPPRLILFGIVGKCFDSGAAVSPAVATAVAEVTRRVREEIEPVASSGSAPAAARNTGGVP